MVTHGSLFSGVGGFDLGFDQAGYDCVFQVEWDKHCQSVLQRHWPCPTQRALHPKENNDE